MKTFTVILFILASVGCLVALNKGYLNWETLKKHIITYFIACGVGLNLYLIYQLLTRV